MKRFLIGMVLLAAVTSVAVASAEQAKTAAKAAPAAKTASLTGELVDMGCYMGHDAKGEKHMGCATKCIANGMPMGLLTADGKLYLLTLDHDNADPYNKCKDWASKQVTVTGPVSEKAGIRSVDVTGAQLAAAK